MLPHVYFLSSCHLQSKTKTREEFVWLKATKVACKSHWPPHLSMLLFMSNQLFLASSGHTDHIFFSLQRGLGSYSFIIFSFICLVTLVYIWLVVPETKNKTFLEICQMFAKRNKVEIKLGDGDLPLNESKESLEDAVRVTAFWRKMRAFRGEEVSIQGGIIIDQNCFNLSSVFFLSQWIFTQYLFV